MRKRGQDDENWQDLKKRVILRDGHCKLIDVISAKDFFILQKKAGFRLSQCDPAHVIAVSACPKLCYEDDNVVLLNRYSHDMLDNCRNPITGERITKEERNNWWRRIVGDARYEKLLKEMQDDNTVGG